MHYKKCSRCGKYNGTMWHTCSECRKYMQRYKAKMGY